MSISFFFAYLSLHLPDILPDCTSRSKHSLHKASYRHPDHALQGVKFEPSSFKLTHEMVVLMGGRNSQGYQLFQQLTVKAFLAVRPYADQLVSAVQLMLDTCLPSFKGEPTIHRLKERFALSLNERHAAEFMTSIVRNAHENVRSTVYDEFQRVCTVKLLSGYLFIVSSCRFRMGFLINSQRTCPPVPGAYPDCSTSLLFDYVNPDRVLILDCTVGVCVACRERRPYMLRSMRFRAC